jgi:nicotinamide-nucleotide amidase
MKQISASVITIGTEILYGHILDTNSQFISNLLSDIGVQVILKSSVGDARDEILSILAYAEKLSSLIFITGGLGPTNDDITKRCLSEYLNSPIRINQQALTEVSAYFKSRGLPFTESNQRQAELPIMAQVITNDMGTAPGMWLERDDHLFISMPGVPHEMQHMLRSKVIPRIRERYQTPIILHKLIMTAGIGESWLADKIAGWEEQLPPYISLAYLPGYGQVKLRLTGTGDEPELVKSELGEKVIQLRKLIPEYIYGEDGLTLQEKIGQILRTRRETISTAESCSGGYVSHLITSIPGSSDYFTGGLVAYQNEVKIKELGVSRKTLEKFGAVSEETVREMSMGCREKFNSDYGISTSGIAGPSGGTPEKPVGTVWMAVTDPSGTITRKFSIAKDRINNIKYSSTAALILLWQRISQKNGTDA